MTAGRAEAMRWLNLAVDGVTATALARGSEEDSLNIMRAQMRYASCTTSFGVAHRIEAPAPGLQGLRDLG